MSEHNQQKDKGAPSPESRHLHFVVVSTDEQFQELRRVISTTLQAFHERVARRLQDGRGTKRPAPDGYGPGAPPMGAPPSTGAWQPNQGYPPPGAPPWVLLHPLALGSQIRDILRL